LSCTKNCVETDKKHWKLKEKFSQADIFIDDISIPDEISVYHSRSLIYFYLFISIFVSAGLTFLLLQNIIISIITAIIVFIAFIRININKIKRKNPIIKISNQGIEINSGFSSWKDIKGDDIISVGSGRNTKQILIFHSTNGLERVCITGLNIGKNKMGKLMILYRNRYLNNL
jgi:hypothetical protein